MGLKTKTLVTLLLSLVVGNVLSGSVSAATTTVYLSPNSASVTNGSTLTVSIREDSGEEFVNVVKLNLTYPVELLDFIGVDDSESEFRIGVKGSGGNGTIEIVRGSVPPIAGDRLIAKINFKAKADNGIAIISFASDSQLIKAGNPPENILSTTNGGEYTLKSASPPSLTVLPTVPTAKSSPSPPVKPQLVQTPSSVASANKNVSVKVITPNTPRTKEQPYVGFWVPMLTLAATLAVSTLVAKGYTVQNIRRHFLFLGPRKVKKHIHI